MVPPSNGSMRSFPAAARSRSESAGWTAPALRERRWTASSACSMPAPGSPGSTGCRFSCTASGRIRSSRSGSDGPLFRTAEWCSAGTAEAPAGWQGTSPGGCSLSDAAPVSWTEARRPLEALRLTPRGGLLVETDAPDQAPAPHRGGRNEPAFLERVVEAMATALGESVPSTGALLSENARRLVPAFALRAV